jgi:hypothetical protein
MIKQWKGLLTKLPGPLQRKKEKKDKKSALCRILINISADRKIQ